MTIPVPEAGNTNTIVLPSANQPPATFSADDVARARSQEKEKLYGEMEKLREQNSNFAAMQSELEALRKEREDREAREASAREQAAQEAKAREEAEMSAKELIERQRAEYNDRFAELERQRVVLEKERVFAELRDYTQARVAQERENITTELLDLVDGNTREEVDASIERLKAKSAAIAEKVRGSQQQLAAQQQGVSPSGFNTTGPMDMLPSTQQYSAEDIAGMSAREYAEKIRPHFLGRGDASRNRGLFG